MSLKATKWKADIVRVKTEITAPIKDSETVKIDTTSVTGLEKPNETKVNKATHNKDIILDKNALYPKVSVFSGEKPNPISEASYEE